MNRNHFVYVTYNQNMGCWKISDIFTGVRLWILPETEMWSSATSQYILVNIFSMLLVMVLVLTLTVLYTHVVLSYEVSSSVLRGITNAVSQEMNYLFKSQTEYMIQNFRYVVKAADYYVSPVHGYVRTLVEKADLDAIDNGDQRKYATWFVEILLLFLISNWLFFVWSRVAKL